jgi:hypothetical protein
VISALLPLLADSDKECQSQAMLALGLAADFQIVPAQEAMCAVVRDHKSPAVRHARPKGDGRRRPALRPAA